jgi:hypothetical protein
MAGTKWPGKTFMRRRSLHIVLIAAIGLLSIGQAYHYHPDGGKHWHLVAFPFDPSTADVPQPDSSAPSHSRDTCLLHFWSSLFSTVSFLLLSRLLPPERRTTLSDWAPQTISAWTGFPLSIRGPPPVLC